MCIEYYNLSFYNFYINYKTSIIYHILFIVLLVNIIIFITLLVNIINFIFMNNIDKGWNSLLIYIFVYTNIIFYYINYDDFIDVNLFYTVCKSSKYYLSNCKMIYVYSIIKIKKMISTMSAVYDLSYIMRCIIICYNYFI